MNAPLKRLHYFVILSAVIASAQNPIPDPAALLKEVLEHQRKTDAIRENYTFHEIIRTDTLDGNGAVKETKTEESEVFFVNGHPVIRLVKKDGAELSPQEKVKEEERVHKEIEGYVKAPRETERGRGGGRARVIGRILALAKTSNPRRVTLHDRPTLVFDFAGDPQAKASGIDQNAVKKVAGTVWIDEADRQVARMEIRFYDNFRIGGGLLASVQKGTSMVVEQAPQGDGLWMQISSEDHLAARIVIKNLRMNVHIQDFDFKKFDTGMKQQIGLPANKE